MKKINNEIGGHTAHLRRVLRELMDSKQASCTQCRNQRTVNLQVLKYTNAQIHKYTNTQQQILDPNKQAVNNATNNAPKNLEVLKTYLC